ncbi:MAG: hypothetical protein ACM31P_10510 [Actinomycetota bacterium]
MTVPAWPPLSEYVATKDVLGFDFSYPNDYLSSIEWQHKDIDAGGDGHGLSFLRAAEVRKDLTFVRKATFKRLVPFARGDNGDWLCCFDAGNSSIVYVINLGDKRLHAIKQPEVGYVQFLNAYRANLDLPLWNPSAQG